MVTDIESILKLLNLVGKSLLVSVVLGSLDFSSLSLHLYFLSLPLHFSIFILQGFFLLSLLLSSETIELFSPEFLFLEIL
jgi:hypothetical protein